MSKKKIIILSIIGIVLIVAILLLIAFKAKNNETPEVEISDNQEIEENINNNQNKPEENESQSEIDQSEPEESSGYKPGKEDVYGSVIKEQITPELAKLTKGDSYPDYNKWLYDVYHTLDEYHRDANIKDIKNVAKMDIYLSTSGKKVFYILSDKNDNKDIIYSKFIMRNNKPDIYTTFFIPVNSYTNNVYKDLTKACEKLGTFESESAVITYTSNRYEQKGRFNVLSQALKENKGANLLSEKELEEFDLYCSLMDNRNYGNSPIYKSDAESFATIPKDPEWFTTHLARELSSKPKEVYKYINSIDVYNLPETKTNFIVIEMDGQTLIYEMYESGEDKTMNYEIFNTKGKDKKYIKVLNKKCKKLLSKKNPTSLDVGQW